MPSSNSLVRFLNASTFSGLFLYRLKSLRNCVLYLTFFTTENRVDEGFTRSSVYFTRILARKSFLHGRQGGGVRSVEKQGGQSFLNITVDAEIASLCFCPKAVHQDGLESERDPCPMMFYCCFHILSVFNRVQNYDFLQLFQKIIALLIAYSLRLSPIHVFQVSP